METRFLHTRLTFRVFIAVALLALVAASYGLGYYGALSRYKSLLNQISPIRDQSAHLQFAKPLLAYSFPETSEIGYYAELETKLKNHVASAKAQGVTRASIYFRDLEGSEKITLNQEYTYAPASLLKVPTLIAYYAYAEKRPDVLNEKLVYAPDVLPFIPFGTPSALVRGRAYSVAELVRYMISDSDNAATMMLLQHIDEDFLRQVYIALGVPEPDDQKKEYLISARAYGLFFRILYNATYLSPEYSDKALALLADTTYVDGLVTGVPKGLRVAHKWGEHVRANGDEVVEIDLHDCGIVYYPRHPYLLCIMTSAKDTDTAKSFISKASSLVYGAVKTRYGNSPSEY